MNTQSNLPPCAEFEYGIVDLCEGSLSPEAARAVCTHVESCARCRAWQAAFLAVDARLAASLPRPLLSADFDRRLEERLAAETRRVPRSELRTRADDEYRRMLDALRIGARRNAVLAGVTAAVLVAGAIVVAPALIADAGAQIASLTSQQRAIVFGSVGAATALAALAWSAMRDLVPGVHLRP